MHFTSKWHRFVIMGILAVTLLPFSNSLLTHSMRKNMSAQMAAASVPGESQDSNTPAASSVQFVNPLPSAQMTIGFGPAIHPFTKKPWQHSGVDLKAVMDTPVQACADGTVIEVQNDYVINEGPGKYLILQHQDGLSSRYAHLNSIKVKTGDMIHAGMSLPQWELPDCPPDRICTLKSCKTANRWIRKSISSSSRHKRHV